MTFTSTDNSPPIFENGKLKPGIYKIQNLQTEGYVDIHEHLKEVCTRPAKDLREGRGLWEIKPYGAGYTIRRVERGKPEQFCMPMGGLENDSVLSVAAYPVAWRIEVVDDDPHRDFEYVRFRWGTTKRLWDLPGGTGTRVQMWLETKWTHPYWIWKLLPVKVEGTVTPSQSSPETLGSGPLPSYEDGASGQSSTRAQHTESERDDFGTIVTEVTTVTTTTRRRYRVEDA